MAKDTQTKADPFGGKPDSKPEIRSESAASVSTGSAPIPGNSESKPAAKPEPAPALVRQPAVELTDTKPEIRSEAGPDFEKPSPGRFRIKFFPSTGVAHGVVELDAPDALKAWEKYQEICGIGKTKETYLAERIGDATGAEAVLGPPVHPQFAKQKPVNSDLIIEDD